MKEKSKNVKVQTPLNAPEVREALQETMAQGYVRGWHKGIDECIERIAAMAQGVGTFDSVHVIGELKALRHRGAP